MAKDSPDTKKTDSKNGHNSQQIIYPIIIYPFTQPTDQESFHLLVEELIKAIRKSSSYKFQKPLIVVNRQTHYRNSEVGFEIMSSSERIKVYKSTLKWLKKHKKAGALKILNVWSVDSCQMWLSGFGSCFDESKKNNRANDVYWLIPGDFSYASPGGSEMLKKLIQIPKSVADGECQLCLGEIGAPVNSSKSLIDTYGTYGLLYTWFPAEAQGIRNITSRPRSEFFAINQEFLSTALVNERWFGYEQTIVILLQNMRGNKTVRTVKSIDLGEVPDDSTERKTLTAAMRQIDRTERLLKLLWRDGNQVTLASNWPDRFRQLEMQSEQVRGAAMTIMEHILT